jgi:hypothetical protein
MGWTAKIFFSSPKASSPTSSIGSGVPGVKRHWREADYRSHIYVTGDRKCTKYYQCVIVSNYVLFESSFTENREFKICT